MPVFGRRLCLLGLTCLPLALTAQSTLYNFITISGVAAKPGSTNGAGGGMNLPLFNNPMTVIQNSAGNFYVADASNNLIRQVTPTGTVTTYAGSPGLIGGTNGKGVDSGVSFNSPQGMALDSAGNLYVADYKTPELAATRFAESRALLAHLGVDPARARHVGAGTGA